MAEHAIQAYINSCAQVDASNFARSVNLFDKKKSAISSGVYLPINYNGTEYGLDAAVNDP